MRSVLLPVAAILWLVRAAFPQPAFEVGTIKPTDTTNGVMNAGVSVYPGGRLVIHALPLKALIMAAYDAGYWQLSGGEEWMGKDVYDVEAKPSAQSGTFSLRHTRFGIGDERVRLMLQTLLIERFRLKVRRETKTGPYTYWKEAERRRCCLRRSTQKTTRFSEHLAFPVRLNIPEVIGSCSTSPCRN